jgi:hypothetical protein
MISAILFGNSICSKKKKKKKINFVNLNTDILDILEWNGEKKSNWKIIETDAKHISLTHIYAWPLNNPMISLIITYR